jgi:hypothetical protein
LKTRRASHKTKAALASPHAAPHRDVFRMIFWGREKSGVLAAVAMPGKEVFRPELHR